jgi:hypothetical protein
MSAEKDALLQNDACTEDESSSECSSENVQEGLGCEDPLFVPLVPPPGPTALAQNIRRLKSRALSVVEKRERLPQPLFWSLFGAELSQIKKRKEKQRALRRVFLGVSDEF